MKRFAFILSALLLFSCSKDENDSGKPDPIIGSWTLIYNNSPNYAQTRTFNEDGTADMIEYSLPDDPYYYTWENPNDNFDSVTQSYILNLDGNTEYLQIIFTPDFNSFRFTWTIAVPSLYPTTIVNGTGTRN